MAQDTKCKVWDAKVQSTMLKLRRPGGPGCGEMIVRLSVTRFLSSSVFLFFCFSVSLKNPGPAIRHQLNCNRQTKSLRASLRPLPVPPAPIEVHRGLYCIGTVKPSRNINPALTLTNRKERRETLRKASCKYLWTGYLLQLKNY